MVNIKIKKRIARFISLVPSNFARVCLYKLLLKYKIELSAKIGYLTIIAVEEARIGKQVNIGSSNLFVGCFKLDIEEKALIGNKNEFIGADRAWYKKFFENCDFERGCKIGKNTLIADYHFFDLIGKFELQENSWIGGRSSQFWSHGGRPKKRMVSVGKNCYLGSGVKFISGTKIGDNIILGAGSVVTKEFEINNALIAGVPAQVIKENYDWKTRKDLFEKD